MLLLDSFELKIKTSKICRMGGRIQLQYYPKRRHLQSPVWGKPHNICMSLTEELQSLNVEQKQRVDDITDKIIDLEKAMTSIQILF